MYEMKTEDVDQDFSSNKEMFDFSNYCSKSKYYDDSNKVVIGKMKDETEGVVIHNEYKDVLLNNKCIRNSTNRIQSKGHKIVIYEIKKSSLSCFDDKIYIQNN